jgi:hypothetical protein
LDDEQLPHAEEADDFTVVSPLLPGILETNPQADIKRVRSWLSHPGHSGIRLPMTRVSNSLLHWLHLYSYIGMS